METEQKLHLLIFIVMTLCKTIQLKLPATQADKLEGGDHEVQIPLDCAQVNFSGVCALLKYLFL